MDILIQLIILNNFGETFVKSFIKKRNLNILYKLIK